MNKYKNINSEQAQKLINQNKNLLILDVRRFGEYKIGKIHNAINIPVDELEWEIEDLKEYQNKPILVYCKAGHRSALACEMLSQEGFTNLYNLAEGTLGFKGDLK